MKKNEDNFFPLNLINELEIELQNDDGYLFNHFEENLTALKERKVSNSLSDREIEFIYAYYKDLKTLENIGDTIGISRERVRQIICKAIYKLRRYKPIFIYGYENYLLKETNQELKTRLLKEQIELKKQLHKKEFNESVLNQNNANITIEELDFSVRSYNALKSNHFNTLGDFVGVSLYDLEKIRNIGKKCVCEIKDKLERYGVVLK